MKRTDSNGSHSTISSCSVDGVAAHLALAAASVLRCAVSYAAFEASLVNETPPADLPPLLAALWFDRKGDFDRAHSIAQDVSGPDGALIHAYLHRKEGDHSNAQYWYRRAGADMPRDGLDAEWERLVRRLL